MPPYRITHVFPVYTPATRRGQRSTLEAFQLYFILRTDAEGLVFWVTSPYLLRGRIPRETSDAFQVSSLVYQSLLPLEGWGRHDGDVIALFEARPIYTLPERVEVVHACTLALFEYGSNQLWEELEGCYKKIFGDWESGKKEEPGKFRRVIQV